MTAHAWSYAEMDWNALEMGMHAGPAHVVQVDQVPSVQVRDWLPVPDQQLHDCELGPTQSQGSHWQVGLHVCEPSWPQTCVAFGEQTPSPVQPDHPDHVPLLHVRVCVPQLPHACVSGPAQVCPRHVPQ
jgi:hypothetical protein